MEETTESEAISSRNIINNSHAHLSRYQFGVPKKLFPKSLSATMPTRNVKLKLYIAS